MRIFSLFCICLCAVRVGCQKVCTSNKTLYAADQDTIKHRVRACIANCFGLVSPVSVRNVKPCNYEKSGNVGNEPCEAKFVPARNDKRILCHDQSGTFPYQIAPSVTACEFISMPIVRYTKDGLLVPIYNDGRVEKRLEDFRRMGIKRILHMGSAGGYIMDSLALAAVSEDQNLRLKFAESLQQTVLKYSLDGVFINWFWPGCPASDCSKNKGNKAHVISFAKEVLGPLKIQGYKIFFMINVQSAVMMGALGDYYSGISPYVDYFPTNSNTNGGRWQDKTVYSNSLKFSKDVLGSLFRMVADKTLADKILYEVSPRASTYELLDPTAKEKIGLKHNKDSNLNSEVHFNEYCEFLKNGSFTLVKDVTTQSQAFMGKYFFTYDDSTSLKAKADFVLERGAGFYINDLLSDIYGGKCAQCGNMHFTRVAAEFLKGRECIMPPPCF